MFSKVIKACTEAFGVLLSPQYGRAPPPFVPMMKASSFEPTNNGGIKSTLDMALLRVALDREVMWAKSYRDAMERQNVLTKLAIVEAVIENPPWAVDDKGGSVVVKRSTKTSFRPSKPVSRDLLLRRPRLTIDRLPKAIVQYLYFDALGNKIPRGLWIPGNSCTDVVSVSPSGITSEYGEMTCEPPAISCVCPTPPTGYIRMPSTFDAGLPQPWSHRPLSTVSVNHLSMNIEYPPQSDSCRALVLYQPVYKRAVVNLTPVVPEAADFLKRILMSLLTSTRLYCLPSPISMTNVPTFNVDVHMDYCSLALMLADKVVASQRKTILHQASLVDLPPLPEGPIFSTSVTSDCLTSEDMFEIQKTILSSASYSNLKSSSDMVVEDLSSLIVSMWNIQMPSRDWYDDVESAHFATNAIMPDSELAEALDNPMPEASPVPEKSVMALVMGYLDSAGPSLGVVVSVSQVSSTSQHGETHRTPNIDVDLSPPEGLNHSQLQSKPTGGLQLDCVQLEGPGASLCAVSVPPQEVTPEEPASPARRRARFDRGGGALFRNAIGGIKKATGSRRASV